MAEHEPNQALPEDETPRIVVPTSDPLPPPPAVSYQRPTLGSAAPARTASERRSAEGRGEAPTQMDNAAKVGSGMAAGITLAASVVVGFLIGQWIDRHWIHSNTPWGTLVMSLVGIAAGFLNLFRIVNATDKTRGPK